MRTRVLVSFVVFFSGFCSGQQKKENQPDFPKKEEIELVVTQAERAFEQYKLSVAVEAELPAAEKDKSSLEKDRQVVELSTKLIEGLKKRPDAFNGLGGLLLLTTLDDASRNAALCANAGSADIAQEVLSKPDTASAYRTLSIVQKCSDVSLHLYTVSESVNALLVRTMEAQENLNQQAMDTIDKCTAALKKAGTKKAGKQ